MVVLFPLPFGHIVELKVLLDKRVNLVHIITIVDEVHV